MVTTKGHQTKQRILEAAAELFYRQGYHSVGINEVLAAAEAPKGSFYHYFDGKEDVAKEAIGYFGERILDRVSTVLLGPDAGSGADALRKLVDAVSEQVQQGRTVASCPLGSLGMQLAPSMPALAALADDYLRRLIGLFREFFRAADARGELAPGSRPEQLAPEFLYLYEGSLVISTVQGTTRPFRDAMDSFVETRFK